MRTIIRKVNDYKEIIYLINILFVFALVMSIITGLSVGDGMLFFFFQVGAMLLPGMALILLLNLKNISKLEYITLAYASGYSIDIVMYYLFVPFGLKNFLWIGFLLLMIVSIIVIMKKASRIHSYQKDDMGIMICGIIILGLTIIETFSFCYANILPIHAGQTIIFNDLLYWTGNTIELTKEYPIIDFRDYPQPYTYHFFSSMQVATIVLSTKLQAIVISLCFSYIQPIILMVFSSYCLFKKCSKKTWLIILGMFLVFFVTGKESVTKLQYVLHMYESPFGFDLAIAFLMLFLVIVISQLNEGKFNPKLCFLEILFFTILVGLKASNGAIALGIMGLVCISWLFKKQYRKAFAYGMPTLFMFIILYIFVVNMKGSALNDTTLEETLKNSGAYIYQIAPSLKYYHEHFLSFLGGGIFKPLAEILFMIFVMILGNFAVYTIFWVMVPVRALYLKKWSILDTICIVVAFVGTTITLNWSFQDGAVQYFIMITYPTTIVFIVRALNDFLDNKKANSKWIIYLGSGIMVVFLLFGFKELWSSQTGIRTSVIKGLNNYKNGTNIQANIDDRAYVSHEDYEAYEWILKNTDENTLITANKGLQMGENESSRHSRAVGVFTERYCVTNDDSDALFYNLDYSKIELLKVIGIGYILYNKDSTEEFKLSEGLGKIVFENDSTVIYQIKQEFREE
ncbi:MAG TPA: hypothetical protein VJ083_09125 [Sedimentibacter sp.]|nr:hypothetical protein [Sedimentibacter sp.]